MIICLGLFYVVVFVFDDLHFVDLVDIVYFSFVLAQVDCIVTVFSPIFNFDFLGTSQGIMAGKSPI